MITQSKNIVNENANYYGEYYWGLALRDGAELSFYADAIEVVGNGMLVAYRVKDGERETLAAWAMGKWDRVWAASVMDGSPVCIEQYYAPKPVRKTATRKARAA